MFFTPNYRNKTLIIVTNIRDEKDENQRIKIKLYNRFWIKVWDYKSCNNLMIQGNIQMKSCCFRFLAVVFPVSSLTYRTVPITQRAILILWCVILLSNSPIWMAHITYQINNGKYMYSKVQTKWDTLILVNLYSPRKSKSLCGLSLVNTG